jgi:hypothetical protein
LRLLGYLLLALLSGCDAPAPYPASADEPAHVFYENDEFYAKHPGSAVFVTDVDASEPYTFTMRPIGAVVAIPRNHLVVVTHQFQPWAKQVYDVASMVALLPEFAPRSRENSEGLMKSESLDRLTITLGSLSNDRSAVQYREAVKNGALLLDHRRSSSDVPVYRKSFDTEGTEPFFALPNPSKFKSPLGNDIVIVCPPKGYEPRHSQYPVGDCRVEVALPPSHFPRVSPDTFGGVAGVQLSYYFNEKYLPEWPTLHSRVLAFVHGVIRQ